ncbi:hypothetical protein BC938DRAFT_481030 [Jimgerdemannia flammicorona]|uniref:Uncharacterized protein n=1 Tax=Jimgerdemannia flammicorona TaxID=994334 RepID=A0A433QH48_9FUNG|nr:hypothetical protein BC938DRAFT_481030 [Jimgerdemannia flammicorona]
MERFAYLYTYMPVHIRLVQMAFENWSDEEDGKADTLFSFDSVSVCCLGGGPGSEVVGLLRHLYHPLTTQRPVLSFAIHDREDLWSKTWRSVWMELCMSFRLTMTSTYCPLNLGDVAMESKRQLRRFDNFDFFTLVKFRSSGCTSEIVVRCLTYIFSQAKIGAYVLYIDTNFPIYNNSVRRILPKIKWVEVFHLSSKGPYIWR